MAHDCCYESDIRFEFLNIALSYMYKMESANSYCLSHSLLCSISNSNNGSSFEI